MCTGIAARCDAREREEREEERVRGGKYMRVRSVKYELGFIRKGNLGRNTCATRTLLRVWTNSGSRHSNARRNAFAQILPLRV